MNLFETMERFPTHASCIEYLEGIRWWRSGGALPSLRKRERLPETGRQTYWAMALQGLSCQLQRSARDGTSRNEDTAPEVVCGSNDYH